MHCMALQCAYTMQLTNYIILLTPAYEVQTRTLDENMDFVRVGNV